MLKTDSLQIRKGTTLAREPAVAAEELWQAIRQESMSLALFFCSPEYDLPALGREIAARFEELPIIGCTTAGEITPLGYLNGALSGVSIASDDFAVATGRVDELGRSQIGQAEALVQRLRGNLIRRGLSPTGENTFAFLLVDGLSMQEELLVSALYRGLGDIQLAGGSAGDGTRFRATYIYHDGAFHTDSAVFSLVYTTHPFMIFKTQHFVSGEEKMVVTQADPTRRIVTEINGLPAGREYARVMGLQVQALTPMIFATHPVVVKASGSTWVRSIEKVNPDESLTFFCAIDEGIVLTVGRSVDLLENLRGTFREITSRIGSPQIVLGCDCILRHLEIEQKNIQAEVSRIFVDHNVIGFSTYGEQFNGMHVNQTFTGVAIGAKGNHP